MLLTSKPPKVARGARAVSLFHFCTRILSSQLTRVLVMLLVCTVFAKAQRMDEPDNTPALNYGTIVLDNGTVIKGEMRFYDQERISALSKNGESNFLTPAEVERFEFFDPALGVRTFLSLPYSEYKTLPERFYFFEVLIEEKTFAVLSGLARPRQNPGPSFMEQIPNLQTGAVNYQGGSVLATFTETIYFIDDSESIASYLVTRYDHIQSIFRDGMKVTIEKQDNQLLKKYLGAHYKSLKKYARENRLSFSTRKDLIKIFLEYRRLVGIS